MSQNLQCHGFLCNVTDFCHGIVSAFILGPEVNLFFFFLKRYKNQSWRWKILNVKSIGWDRSKRSFTFPLKSFFMNQNLNVWLKFNVMKSMSWFWNRIEQTTWILSEKKPFCLKKKIVSNRSSYLSNYIFWIIVHHFKLI